MILAHLRSPPVACFSPTHRGESEPPFGTSSMVRPAGSREYRVETQGRERNSMIRRILAVVAIVIGVLVLFTSHAFGISALHLLAIGVVVLGAALVLPG
jgi:hypothetical protein